MNYYFGNRDAYYLPCLLDLERSEPIVLYTVPSVDRLDEVVALRQDDNVAKVADEWEGPITFRFDVLPAVLPAEPWEIGRFGVEGLYALAWGGEFGNAGLTRDGVPAEAFVTTRPHGGAGKQSIPEEIAYLRFRRAMYANDVARAAASLPNSAEIPAAEIEAAIAVGPGLFPPNVDGVWLIVTSVPMRIAPELVVEFEDGRYRAETVDLSPGDTRLSTVRVRFKVFDTIRNAYVKKRVAIRKWALPAEL
ncbi:hypothetical protein ACSFA8_04830 [Variovorax sp. RT4R15]|uniref:hypothetical protein n=1 Tax=Variovorax sp. RT4R15 TaxID=3443737 RepID=UPI003F4472D6